MPATRLVEVRGAPIGIKEMETTMTHKKINTIQIETELTELTRAIENSSQLDYCLHRSQRIQQILRALKVFHWNISSAAECKDIENMCSKVIRLSNSVLDEYPDHLATQDSIGISDHVDGNLTFLEPSSLKPMNLDSLHAAKGETLVLIKRVVANLKRETGH